MARAAYARRASEVLSFVKSTRLWPQGNWPNRLLANCGFIRPRFGKRARILEVRAREPLCLGERDPGLSCRGRNAAVGLRALFVCQLTEAPTNVKWAGCDSVEER